MSKKIKNNIEVAVRTRPLNTFENRLGEESAWEINRFGETPMKQSCEKGTLIQLKNKFRFGLA